jgi:ligand-binding SRPBCC domain-containing protein
VPTISRFFGITISMYFKDHGFPHFHAFHADGEAKVRIDNLEVIESSLKRRQLRYVLAWAELHQAELEENWHRARVRETLKEIEPLQ